MWCHHRATTKRSQCIVIIRALDQNGDITFGSGQQNYLTGQAAIAQNIKTRILCFLNNCVWDMQAGIDWFSYLKQSANAAQVELAVKAQILQSYGVTSVNQVSVNVKARNITLSYNINTIFTTNFAATINNIANLVNNGA